MAELKVPNLCGATAEFNAIQDKFESLISDALDSLESEASALASSATSALNALESDLRSLIPELPALPDTNLQAQLTSLSGLIPGSAQHKTLLADITTKFDSALTTSGLSLDTLVSDAKSAITGGADLCSAVPNFTVPAAGGDAVEKAIESKQAIKDSVEEKLSTLLANVNFTAMKAAVEETFASYEEIGEEVPNEDIGPYRVTEETTSIARASAPGANIKAMSDDEMRTPKPAIVNTQKATTPKNSVGAATSATVEETNTTKTISITESGGEVTVRKRSNVAKEGKGFTRRTISITQDITEDDFDFSDKFPYNYEIRLKHIPLKIRRARGWNDSLKKKFKWVNIYPPTNPIIQAQASRGKILTDTWELKGKTLIVTDLRGAGYGPHPKSELYFRVTYSYLDNYDPNYAGAADEE